jgi:hypothetical protein
MEYIKIIKLIIVAWPDIVRLIKAIEDHGNKQKLKEDLHAIEEAFKNRDADALNKHFNRV